MIFTAPEVSATRGAELAHVPDTILLLADRLKKIHGNVRIAREKHGFHVYCASPAGLERHGRIELTKMHLAINVEMYLGIGRYARRIGSYNADSCARCMKTGTNYRMTDLLSMPPLAARGIVVHDANARVRVNDTSRSLVRDRNGNLVPDVPGDTVSLLKLPADHPAIFYLTQRGYSIPGLVEQFGAEFCYRELPEDRSKGRGYRRFCNGFADTPQNRIIFYADIMGVRTGWQAR